MEGHLGASQSPGIFYSTTVFRKEDIFKIIHAGIKISFKIDSKSLTFIHILDIKPTLFHQKPKTTTGSTSKKHAWTS